MIKVTVWYEYAQECGVIHEDALKALPEEWKEHSVNYLKESAEKMKAVYPNGMMAPLVEHLSSCEDMQVRYVTMYMPEYGLTDEVLNDTDVLIWWAHVAHDVIPDSLVEKIKERVLKGMGFIPLHSAHPSKPMKAILGTSGSLRWREADRCRVWNTCPTHPIAKGIPEYFELDPEEMYGEHFDIPNPDDVVFITWFAGGEVFRGGCTWTRGYGKIFYFHPGHETNPTYYNPYVKKIIENAVRWAAPTMWRADLGCPHAQESPEAKLQK